METFNNWLDGHEGVGKAGPEIGGCQEWDGRSPARPRGRLVVNRTFYLKSRKKAVKMAKHHIKNP
jgi:hypothetical protein